MQAQTKRRLLRGAAVFAALFGALTIRSGSSALFGDGAAGGHYVAFVIWFNFLAGFAYVGTAVGLWFGQRWSARLALCLAVLTVAVFGAFGAHIASGGLFEARTVWAMTARSIIWTAIAALAYWALGGLRRRTPT